MHIHAAVVRRPGGRFAIEELELDDPRPDEVRVRLVATGVCHTDAVVRDQTLATPLPAVLGHEGAGVVEAVGAAVRGVAPGDHVVLTVNSCGRCGNCLSGSLTYCDDIYAVNFSGRRPDGSTSLSAGGAEISSYFFGQSSFATHANVAERSVVKVGKDLPLGHLGPLGCGVQTGAGAVFNTLRPAMGSSIAIFGTGAVGFSAMLAALVVGCTTIVAVDINESRLSRAEALGATHTVNSAREDPTAVIMALTGGRGVDYALDTTGVSRVLRQAVDSLAVRGTVGVVGASRAGTEASIEIGSTMSRGWTLKMIIEGDAVPQVFIPRLIELWQRGRFPFDRIIEEFDFAEINKAFDAAEDGSVIKPVLVFPRRL
jgi:aryl-alcohol dehydrogenase